MVTVSRYPDLAHLLDDAAANFASVIADREAHVVLTGGGAGIGLLEKLRDMDLDWSRVHVYFGDERNVSVDHEDSNEGQARRALLNHVNIPADNIHGYGLGDGRDMDEAARAYAAILPERFDLHLLGMGGEGHINSLFPHTAALLEDTAKVVAVSDSPKPPAERVTLTLPAVHSADRVWLLVAGAEKAEAAEKVMAGADWKAWPAAGAQGREETVLYYAA